MRIEASSDGKKWGPLIVDSIPVDDMGYDIEIICKKKKYKKNMGLYEVRWYNPVRVKGELYRFVILARKGQKVLYSRAFK